MDIKTLTGKKGKFTQEEIEFLIQEGAKHGIEPPKNENCPNCWRDMAIQIAVAMKPHKGVHFKGDLREHGVLFLGRVLTDADLEDGETLAWMKENRFPEYLLTNED